MSDRYAAWFTARSDARNGHDRIEALRGTFDLAAVLAAWEAALAARMGQLGCVHGDLQPANLLVHHGRISAVIDFGLLAVTSPLLRQMVHGAARR